MKRIDLTEKDLDLLLNGLQITYMRLLDVDQGENWIALSGAPSDAIIDRKEELRVLRNRLLAIKQGREQ